MLSFTAQIKHEIIEKHQMSFSVKMYELYAILYSKHSFTENGVELRTDNISVAKYVYSLIKELTHLELMVKYTVSNKMAGYKIYTISLPNKHLLNQLEALFERLAKKFNEKNASHVKGYLRGLFLTTGYIKQPEKEYALDFFIENQAIAFQIYEVLAKMGLRVFVTDKGNKSLVYVRNCEDISDILVIMECMQAFFKYQEVTIYKEMKNKTIRSLNWEVANETKSIEASDRYIKMINTIDQVVGLENLTIVLQDTAHARVEFQDLTLQDLAAELSITKSGLRNRLRRIESIYNFIENGGVNELE
ncbi:MAG: DNA-binding protein WhiA [Fusobacteria bacterium]|nr:DNA-binding protein WhiA [Fusobacteriota bacterium]